MSSGEEWRAVPGYVGHYEVSSLGRIRSVDRTIARVTGDFPVKGRVILQSVHPKGYHHVRLYLDGVGRTAKVHKLVALTFHGEPTATNLEVRHLNDNKADNRASNLRWGTRQENMLDRVRNGLDPNATKTHCPTGHPYDALNTKITTVGFRECRTCNVEKNRRYKARRAQAKAS